MDKWAQLHSELSNKFRWALATSLQSADLSLPYRASADWGRQLATAITEDAKAMDEKPNYQPWKRGESSTKLRVVG